MLLGDRAKYIMLISNLTFAALLMTEQAAIFCRIMQWSRSTLDNIGAGSGQRGDQMPQFFIHQRGVT
jgi:hypothetical protein